MSLKAYIKKRGKTTQEVADYLGILRGSLYNKIYHKRPFKICEALKIKEFLNMSNDEFFEIFNEYM